MILIQFENNNKTVIHCEAPLVDKRIVKSSSGYREQRYVIQTLLKIGDDTWNIEMTLTNRDSMGFRMLLGREAMSGRVLVDPEQKYLLGQPTVDNLKNYTRMQKKQVLVYVLAFWPAILNCTATNELWKLVKCEDMKCIF